jgi:hypothetical protein
MTPGSNCVAHPTDSEASPLGSASTQRRQRIPLVPLLLALLALLDLRIELQLLFDHVTFSSLLAAIRNHLLAVMVLIFTPSLFRRYRF